MKEIKTNNFQKKQADLVTSPPIDGEGDGSTSKGKKWQYSYQLGKWMLVTKDE